MSLRTMLRWCRRVRRVGDFEKSVHIRSAGVTHAANSESANHRRVPSSVLSKAGDTTRTLLRSDRWRAQANSADLGAGQNLKKSVVDDDRVHECVELGLCDCGIGDERSHDRRVLGAALGIGRGPWSR